MMPKDSNRIVAAVLLVAALGATSWLVCASGLPMSWFGDDSGTASPPPPSADRQRVMALGRLEPAEGLIEVSGLVGDRVESFEIAGEGSEVTKGQALAYLASRALRQIELEAAEVSLAEAQARLVAEEKAADAAILTAHLAVKQAEASQRDIEAQREKIGLADANLALATKDLGRLEGLSEDLVSEQQRERQVLVVHQADAELSAAKALLEKMERTKELGLEAARADLLAAKAGKSRVLASIPIASLEKRVELAEIQWQRTAILAPCDGVVLKIFMQPGESVGAGPILQMADFRQMVVVATVYETDIKHVRLGQRAVVKSKAFKPPHDQEGLQGEVVRIGGLITAPQLRSLNQFEPVDRHVVEVRIQLEEEGCKLARCLSNLQVDVEILKTATEALMNR